MPWRLVCAPHTHTTLSAGCFVWRRLKLSESGSGRTRRREGWRQYGNEEPGSSAELDGNEEPGSSAELDDNEEPGSSAELDDNEEPGSSAELDGNEEPGGNDELDGNEEPGGTARRS